MGHSAMSLKETKSPGEVQKRMRCKSHAWGGENSQEADLGKHKEVSGGGKETAQKIWVRGGIVTGGPWEGDPKGRKPFRLNRRDSRLQKLLRGQGGGTQGIVGEKPYGVEQRAWNPALLSRVAED